MCFCNFVVQRKWGKGWRGSSYTLVFFIASLSFDLAIILQNFVLNFAVQSKRGRGGASEPFPFPPQPDHLRHPFLTVTLSYERIATYDKWTSSAGSKSYFVKYVFRYLLGFCNPVPGLKVFDFELFQIAQQWLLR